MNGTDPPVFDLFQGNTEDRIRTLEQRVEVQEDEITLLKSSLADVLRRMKDLEGGFHLGAVRKPSPMKNHFQPLPSRPVLEGAGTPKARARPPSPSTLHTKRSPSAREEPSKTNGHSPTATEFRRAGSTETVNRDSKRASFRSRKPSGGGTNHKQTSYNEEDGSVRMYLRGRPVVMYKPSSLEPYDISVPSQVPDNKLKLEWVYGYRGKDCRSNLYFLPTGEIVYFVAAVVVMYDPKDGYQRHYLGHNDDVKCLAIHPDKLKIATGQVSGLELDGRPRLPQVHIWDAVSLNTLHIIASFERAVACLSFSKTDGGTYLCAIDESNDHVLTVWNWAKEAKVAEVKSSKDPVLSCEFNPHLEGSIVTCGKNHINFWTMDGEQLNKKQGLFEKHEKPKYLLCLAFTASGDVLSGDSNGNIQQWGKGATRKISRVIEGVHDGPVFSICATRDNCYITGGKDGYVKKWNDRFALTQQTHVGEQAGSVRTVCCDNQGVMLVGTKKNCVLRGSFDSSLELLVHGHTDELWGLAVHPVRHQFLTGASDKQLILWDAARHTPVWVKNLDDGIQSADFHPTNANVIAVGMVTGRWLLLDTSNMDLLTVHTDGSEQHDVVKFSPDGNLLAIGSHDNNIYVYNVSHDGRKVTRHGKCSGHSSYITHLDWSVDSQHLQSNSGDYELLFWEMQSCRQITGASQLRDVEWHTQSCTLGFTVLGVWPEGADGTDVNSVCRSHGGRLVASGDDFGKVHLYRYPAVQPRSVGHAYNGHSSHVTTVQFMRDDDRVISTGGQDCSVMQWKVV